MNKLMISNSVSNADMYYSCGILVSDPFIYLETSKKKYIIANKLEFNRMKKEINKDILVLPFESYVEGAKKKFKKLTMAHVAYMLMEEKKVRQVYVPAIFPFVYSKVLQKLGVKLKSKNQFSNRLVKNKEEIGNILSVQRIADKGCRHAISLIRKSKIKGEFLYLNERKLTSEILKKEVEKLFLNYELESPDGIIISSGKQTELPHHSGSGFIHAGVPIVIDIYPRSKKNRYFCDMTRTVCKGKPLNPRIINIYNMVLEAQKQAYRKIKPRVKAREVHKAVVDYFKIKGLNKYFLHSTGHGVGLELHESPGIPSNYKLKEGMVITNEPGLYVPGVGGVRIEDTLVVTKKGFKFLTKTEKKFII